MTSPTKPMPSRTRTVRRATAAVLCVAATGGAVVGTSAILDRLDSDEPAIAVESDTNIVTAEIRDLSETFTATGTLQFDDAIDIPAPAAGTVLSVIGAGTTLRNGDVIGTVDDQVVVWLDGEIPAWRTLDVGDEGPDVLQLETALATLGFNIDNDVTVDEEYTSATASMVKDWQAALGVEPTGRVDLGTAVFGGARTRIASSAVGVGDTVNDGAPLVSMGSTTRYATLDATPSEAVTLRVGESATLELPDRSEIDGTVAAISAASDTWQITVAFDDTIEFPAADVTNVEMSWTHDIADGVLTIPSSSLLRLDDGSYVVDVVGADGTTSSTRVGVGIALGTRVEITDGLEPGAQVISL